MFNLTDSLRLQNGVGILEKYYATNWYFKLKIPRGVEEPTKKTPNPTLTG